jgi:hypothetical protein
MVERKRHTPSVLMVVMAVASLLAMEKKPVGKEG